VIGYRTNTSGAGRELDTDILQMRTGYRTNTSGVGREPYITITTDGGREPDTESFGRREQSLTSEAGRETDTKPSITSNRKRTRYRTITSGAEENQIQNHHIWCGREPDTEPSHPVEKKNRIQNHHLW
jgi:hypothetical protein